MNKGFHHIGLFVSDIERSLKFYTEGLNGTVTHSFMGSVGMIYMVELAAGAVVELIPKSVEGSGAPWAHIAIDVEGIHAAFDKAVAAGASVQSAVRESNLNGMYMANAFIVGPDGEVIEFFEVRA